MNISGLQRRITAVILSAIVLAGCGGAENNKQLVVLHCHELMEVLTKTAGAFEQAHPEVDVRLESASTMNTIQKLTELSRACDVIAVTDPKFMRSRLYPERLPWTITFAGDEVVIAAADRSRYVNEIDGERWFQILLREDVSFARVSERLDPFGRATLFCWQLADEHYGEYRGSLISEALLEACPANNVRSSSKDLSTLLEMPSGPDYVFLPRSVAERHRLRFVELPDEINLGAPQQADIYAKAKLTLTGPDGEKRLHSGHRVMYAFGVPKSSERKTEAVEFARLLLDRAGRQFITEAGLRPVLPPDAVGAVPERLQPFMQSME